MEMKVAGVENLYAGVLGELYGSDPMQLLRKLANSELECTQHQRFFDLYFGSRRPRYKRKNSKKSAFKSRRKL